MAEFHVVHYERIVARNAAEAATIMASRCVIGEATLDVWPVAMHPEGGPLYDDLPFVYDRPGEPHSLHSTQGGA